MLPTVTRWPFLLALAITGLPATVAAESGVPGCRHGTPDPMGPYVSPRLRAFRFRDVILPFASTQPDLALVQTDGVTELPLDATVRYDAGDWTLTPALPLETGKQYVVVDRTCVATGHPETRWWYYVPLPEELPTVLGVTTVSDLTSRRRRPGEPLLYTVSVHLEADPSALEVGEAYEVTHTIDDTLGFWRVLGSYTQTVEIDCIEETPERTLTHRFDHRARMYGDAEPSLSTDPVLVELRCGDAIRVDPVTGRPLTPEEAEAMDHPPDAGPPPVRDAGPVRDAETDLDAGAHPDVSGAEPVAGCTCRAGARPGASSWLALALAALIANRRPRGQPSALGRPRGSGSS